VGYVAILSLVLEEIVSRDFVVCFLVSFDSSEVSTHTELVHLLFNFRFRVKFFDFRVSAVLVYYVSGAVLLDYPQLLP
jgi:hypothetical protein